MCSVYLSGSSWGKQNGRPATQVVGRYRRSAAAAGRRPCPSARRIADGIGWRLQVEKCPGQIVVPAHARSLSDCRARGDRARELAGDSPPPTAICLRVRRHLLPEAFLTRGRFGYESEWRLGDANGQCPARQKRLTLVGPIPRADSDRMRPPPRRRPRLPGADLPPAGSCRTRPESRPRLHRWRSR